MSGPNAAALYAIYHSCASMPILQLTCCLVSGGPSDGTNCPVNPLVKRVGNYVDDRSSKLNGDFWLTFVRQIDSHDS